MNLEVLLNMVEGIETRLDALAQKIDRMNGLLEVIAKNPSDSPEPAEKEKHIIDLGSIGNRIYMDTLRSLGYKPFYDRDNQKITFYHHGNKITFFPRKGYFNGKGLVPGHGFENLKEQLLENPIKVTIESNK